MSFSILPARNISVWDCAHASKPDIHGDAKRMGNACCCVPLRHILCANCSPEDISPRQGGTPHRSHRSLPKRIYVPLRSRSSAPPFQTSLTHANSSGIAYHRRLRSRNSMHLQSECPDVSHKARPETAKPKGLRR